MIVIFDDEVFRAIAMLETNGHFKVIRRWIAACKEKSHQHLVAATRGEDVYREQGDARTLTEIEEHFSRARVRSRSQEP